ncbi:MAG TPA: aminoglycoside phosphotransferase family protein [Candidatus Nanoarchaeia archaeon]|nr:aminoglycoside phosphotransferase family protein [Candidatus Nanoarchaeia archaeon]
MTSKSQLGKVIRRIFPESRIRSISLRRGFFNENWIIGMDSRKVVVRVFDEPWKAKKEEFLYGLIRKKTDVPVPEVYYCDVSRKILSKPYLALSLCDGRIAKDAKELEKRTIMQMGSYLAKIHSVRMKSFGWIIGDAIRPSFSKWKDFMDYDFGNKLAVIRKHGDLGKEIDDIRKTYNCYQTLFDVREKPCLLHKDFHLQNIFIKGDKVSGVIDWEWALGGHNELDISKSVLFMFEKNPGLEKEFIKGYLRHGSLKGFEKRKSAYRFVNIVGNLSLAFQLGNRKAAIENKARLAEMLKQMP